MSDSRDHSSVALDPLIHAEARLRIMVTLSTLHAGEELSFSRLQSVLGLTSGNLITHLRKLQEADYVRSTGRGKHLLLTDRGRVALADYRAAIARLLG